MVYMMPPTHQTKTHLVRCCTHQVLKSLRLVRHALRWLVKSLYEHCRHCVLHCNAFRASCAASHWQDKLKHHIQLGNYPDWMLKSIAQDLQPYVSSGIRQQILDAQCAEQYQNIVKFEIFHNQVTHHATEGCDQFRLRCVIYALRALAKCTPLPNVQFLVELEDHLDETMGPTSRQPKSSSTRSGLSGNSCQCPIFTFAKSTSQFGILIPDCDALLPMKYEKLSKMVRLGDRLYPWSCKTAQVFWRGATTGGPYTMDTYAHYPRFKLVKLTSEFPSLINACFTGLPQTDPSVRPLLAPFTAPPVTLSEHLKYKYQILVDGNSCAYSRAYWQLLANCLMFKQDSNHIQWYYRALLPWIHYVPVAHDLHDLVDKIAWARAHDTESQQIAANGTRFAEQNLKRSNVYLHWYLALHAYAKLQ